MKAYDSLNTTLLNRDIWDDIAHHLIGPKLERWIDYRDKWKASNRFEYVPERFPLQVTAEHQFKCNTRCIWCPHSYDEETKKKYGDENAELSYGDMTDIILDGGDDLCSFIPQGMEEPLLNPWLWNIVRFSVDFGIPDVWFSTNGKLFDSDHAIEAIDSGLTRLEFSCDSKTRKSKILYLLAVQRKLHTYFPRVRVSFVRSPITEMGYRDSLKYWASIVDYIAVQHCTLFEPIDLFPGHKNIPTVDPHNFRCPQPMQQVFVRSNGDVTPCCTPFMEHIVMGNIHDDKISTIWKSERFRAFRRMHLELKYRDNPTCALCVDGRVRWE